MIERRADGRVEIYAQAQVRRGHEVYVLAVGDVSRKGLFLEADPAACPDVHWGETLELLIFAPELEAGEVTAQARVVRTDRRVARPGFAVEIVGIDPENLARWTALLDAAGRAAETARP